MRKIINGKRYDTETATLVGSACASYAYTSDFEYWEEELYKTPRSGAYFVYGTGGPKSRWAQTIGQNDWSGGSGIKPLSDDAAFEWAQANLSVEEVEAHFADRIDDA